MGELVKIFEKVVEGDASVQVHVVLACSVWSADSRPWDGIRERMPSHGRGRYAGADGDGGVWGWWLASEPGHLRDGASRSRPREGTSVGAGRGRPGAEVTRERTGERGLCGCPGRYRGDWAALLARVLPVAGRKRRGI